jgi:hypothetical protein
MCWSTQLHHCVVIAVASRDALQTVNVLVTSCDSLSCLTRLSYPAFCCCGYACLQRMKRQLAAASRPPRPAFGGAKGKKGKKGGRGKKGSSTAAADADAAEAEEEQEEAAAATDADAAPTDAEMADAGEGDAAADEDGARAASEGVDTQLGSDTDVSRKQQGGGGKAAAGEAAAGSSKGKKRQAAAGATEGELLCSTADSGLMSACDTKENHRQNTPFIYCQCDEHDGGYICATQHVLSVLSFLWC